MNNDKVIETMVSEILEIERKYSKDKFNKFNTDGQSKKNIVKEILSKLDEVTKNEDTES